MGTTTRRADHCRWWINKDTRRKGTPVAVRMENPNDSVLELDGPDAAFRPIHKNRGNNAKQYTWVLLLTAHCAAGFMSWLANILWALIGAIKKRCIFAQGARMENQRSHGKGTRFLFRLVLVLLVTSFAFLAFEVVAHLSGWHYFHNHNLHRIPQTLEIRGWLHTLYITWLEFRCDYIAPTIRALSCFCVALFLIQSTDRLILCLSCFWINCKKIKPRVEGDPFKSDDLESFGCNTYPMVLVQIPMCNEREVYEQSILAVSQLDWPKERLLIQVLDDSNDESIRCLIKGEVSKWSQKGVNIIYRHRSVRTGYKAGNLKSAMNCDYVKAYEFVAIFDADFQPNPDFLKLTVPHFKNNPELGLVQTRWDFVNKDQNLLTRLQDINLCFHFEVEQQVNGVFLNFFGFNGTAGVWRIKALEESGGWLERTTVEDMDIAVRAHLHGWKFIYLNDVKVLCEVPESYEAYKKQQHRWHSGPMQLFRLCLPAIVTSKISFWKKANLILLFFLLRKLILPFYSFTLFCIILPLTMFVPEAELPAWVICYVPVVMSVLGILPTPGSFPFIAPYLLFENTMSVTKFNAMVSGLFQLGSSYEWVVTKKAGRSSEPNHLLAAAAEAEAEAAERGGGGEGEGEGGEAMNIHAQLNSLPELNKLKQHYDHEAVPEPLSVKKTNKIYKKEIAVAVLLLTAALRSLLSAHGVHFYFLLFQGLSFLLVGLDLIGEQMR